MAVTYLFVLVFLGMMGYICHFAVTNEQTLINNSYNARQGMLLAQNRRGNIYSNDGTILAETKTEEDGTERRVYPYANLFAHAVGYSTNGKMGVEALGNYYLINSNEPISNKVSADMAGTKYAGDSVYTTLDMELQEVAYNALGVYKGAVIVTEPSTGKILAMVSKPDFDPNNIDSMWETLLADEESSVLLNRVTQGMYPPGSTFKIVTALQYIRENTDSYSGYRYNCAGSYQSGEDRINCYHGTSHGSIDFKESFAKSCNASFANIGLSLNEISFAKTLKDLLFNEELPLETAYSQSKVTVEEDMATADMMQVSIGQGTTQISPIHLNMITCAIANDGKLMKPYMIDRVENSEGTVIKQFSTSSYGNLMTENEASILTELMEEVVESGTGRKLAGLSYTAAGKTGSAEYNTVKGDSHAWFTGFAPAENPQVCVTIIVEGAGSGGDFAVPIAKRIFDAYLE
ncbi:MAG: penicillin-binding protein 2 [Lachnospiraceae bacterium]|nr:penicillin-binding protein 2 [Lachnospiraceae bacterium]